MAGFRPPAPDPASSGHVRTPAAPIARVMRTTASRASRSNEGHVLMGTTRNLSRKLQASPDFLVLLDPVHRTGRAAHALPTLVLQRSFVGPPPRRPDRSNDQSLEPMAPFSSGMAAARPLII